MLPQPWYGTTKIIRCEFNLLPTRSEITHVRLLVQFMLAHLGKSSFFYAPVVTWYYFVFSSAIYASSSRERRKTSRRENGAWTSTWIFSRRMPDVHFPSSRTEGNFVHFFVVIENKYPGFDTRVYIYPRHFVSPSRDPVLPSQRSYSSHHGSTGGRWNHLWLKSHEVRLLIALEGKDR